MVKTTRLRKLRMKYHITLAALSDAAGISTQRLSEYERAERSASAGARRKIADAFRRLAETNRDRYQALCEELTEDTSDILTAFEVPCDEY